jgi:hypothetical protein
MSRRGALSIPVSFGPELPLEGHETRGDELRLQGECAPYWDHTLAAGEIELKAPPDTWVAASEISPDPSCATRSGELMNRFRLNR